MIMKLFSKQSDGQKESDRGGIQNAPAQKPEWIDKSNEWTQTRKIAIAIWLTRLSEKLTQRGKKTFLIIFAFVVSAICLFLILAPFTVSRGTSANRLPGNDKKHNKTTPPPLTNAPVISEGDLNTMIKFRRTLDSLKRHDPDTYNSLTQGRQGLIDSIDFLIRFNEAQQ